MHCREEITVNYIVVTSFKNENVHFSLFNVISKRGFSTLKTLKTKITSTAKINWSNYLILSYVCQEKIIEVDIRNIAKKFIASKNLKKSMLDLILCSIMGKKIPSKTKSFIEWNLWRFWSSIILLHCENNFFPNFRVFEIKTFDKKHFFWFRTENKALVVNLVVDILMFNDYNLL